MAWESSRPVPWKRLMVQWVVIGILVAFVSFAFTDNRDAGSYLSIFLAGFVYVGLGAVLAKFGYTQKSLQQIRAEAAAAPPRTVGATSRAKPAPTKRTSTGPSQQPRKKKR